MDNRIISPEVGCESFTVPNADGTSTTYTRTDTLALGRARLMQRFQMELQFNLTINGVQKSLLAIRKAFNSQRYVDGCVLLDKLMTGTDLAGGNRQREMEIVALFYNAPDEDPTTYDHAAIMRKGEAWRAIDSGFFLGAALAALLHTSPHYPPLEGFSPEAAASPLTTDPSPKD